MDNYKPLSSFDKWVAPIAVCDDDIVGFTTFIRTVALCHFACD
ncbi:hypothetical protein [Shouchella lonarensis]|nr:hypothetical protein [Shouchella lonarensis]